MQSKLEEKLRVEKFNQENHTIQNRIKELEKSDKELLGLVANLSCDNSIPKGITFNDFLVFMICFLCTFV